MAEVKRPEKPSALPGSRSSSARREAAVDGQRDAGHETRLVRHQPQGRVGDLVRLDEPAHRDIGHQLRLVRRSEEHTSELQSLMRISYAVFCLKKKKEKTKQ